MTKFRIFKISINILVFHLNSDTRAFKINNRFEHFLFSFWFSLLAILFGWWGIGFNPWRAMRNNFEAIYINMTGGIDYTKEAKEREYDDKTNYVWNNLSRKTTQKISKDELEIIIEIQEEFEMRNGELYTAENIDFINIFLPRVNVRRKSAEEIKDVFDALKMYGDGKTVS